VRVTVAQLPYPSSRTSRASRSPDRVSRNGGEGADHLEQEPGAEAVGDLAAERDTPQRHLDPAGPQLLLDLRILVRLRADTAAGEAALRQHHPRVPAVGVEVRRGVDRPQQRDPGVQRLTLPRAATRAR
jgi:hypothetical protein